jgi:hypothetical protein
MSTQPILTDADLEAMLARRAGPGAPLGLAEAIEAALAEAPDGRRPWWSVLAPPRTAAPALRFAWVITAVGLLLAATVSAVLVGSELFRRANQLTVVPPPTIVPVPTAVPAPSSEPVAVDVRPVDQVNDLAFAPDGTLWLATRAGIVHRDPAIGLPATGYAALYDQNAGLPTTEATRVAVAPDGTVWASGAAWVARFDGAWTAYSESGELGTLSVAGDLGGLTVAADGTLWVAARTDGGRVPALLRFDGIWTAVKVPDEIAGSAFPWTLELAAAPDGDVWAYVPGTGVAVFDGADWRTYTKETAGLPREPQLAGVARNGDVWVELVAEGCVATGADPPTCATPAAGVARFDGSRWTAYTTTDGLVADDALLSIGSDGTVWATYASVAGAVSRFDGQRWVTTQASALTGARALGAAPDGALWLTKSDGVLRFDGAVVTHLSWPVVEATMTLPPLTLRPAASETVTRSALGTITWRVYEIPPERFPWGLVGTPHGPAFVDGFVDLRWLGQDGSWQGTKLPIEATDTALVGADLVVSGSMAMNVSWDGSRWILGERLDVPPLLGRIRAVASGPRGTILAGGPTGVACSTDGRNFEMSAGGPAASYVLATPDGFVALVAHGSSGSWGNPPLEPEAWFSADCAAWERVGSASPFGKGAKVRGVAARDGRYVAIGNAGTTADGGTVGGGTVGGGYDMGGPIAAWVSDDAISWERLPALVRAEPCSPDGPCLHLLASVVAGEEGWMIVAWDGAAWTSTDGRTWEPLSGWPGVNGGYLPPLVGLGGGVIAASGGLAGFPNGAVVIGTIEP